MTRRVELYLRESAPHAARQSQLTVLGRLRALAEAAVVDEVTVTTWAHRVDSTEPVPSPASTTHEAFEEWASQGGVSLGPAFDSHDCHSAFTGSHYRTTVYPVMCVAVYEDDDLVEVYPHSRNGRSVSVLDGLAMFECPDSAHTTDTTTVP